MAAHRIPAQDLVPGDVALHEGRWIEVSGLVHDVAAGIARVTGTTPDGEPAEVEIPDTESPWTLLNGAVIPGLT